MGVEKILLSLSRIITKIVYHWFVTQKKTLVHWIKSITTGLDLRVFFQHKWFYDSMNTSLEYTETNLSSSLYTVWLHTSFKDSELFPSFKWYPEISKGLGKILMRTTPPPHISLDHIQWFLPLTTLHPWLIILYLISLIFSWYNLMESSEDALMDNLAIEFLTHLYGECTSYVLCLPKNPASNIEKSSLDTLISTSKYWTNSDHTLIIYFIII